MKKKIVTIGLFVIGCVCANDTQLPVSPILVFEESTMPETEKVEVAVDADSLTVVPAAADFVIEQLASDYFPVSQMTDAQKDAVEKMVADAEKLGPEKTEKEEFLDKLKRVGDVIAGRVKRAFTWCKKQIAM